MVEYGRVRTRNIPNPNPITEYVRPFSLSSGSTFKLNFVV